MKSTAAIEIQPCSSILYGSYHGALREWKSNIFTSFVVWDFILGLKDYTELKNDICKKMS